jgi:hypothetical protein
LRSLCIFLDVLLQLPAVEEELNASSKDRQDEESQEDDNVLVRQLEVSEPVRHYDLGVGYLNERIKADEFAQAIGQW